MSDPDDVPDADVALIQGEQPASAKLPLDRDRIVAAAIAFIDEFGLPGLTMRRLGGILGVEAMSLYRYVPGKEALLDAVVDSLVEQMEIDEHVLRTPDNGWQDFLHRLAHGIRRIALAHPTAFPLIASRPPEAPWLRPPLRSLSWVEDFLAGLTAEGFDEESAVGAYRGFTSFLLGHLLLEVSTHGADVGPLDVLDEGEFTKKGLGAFPLVKKLRPLLSEDRAAIEFEDALENLLDRLALVRSESS
ncbi:MAG: transcriptional regulator, TetR family [Nocardioidaceae bacterium]|nr:transcriptional regulator, TetR family [Nocardioidaceae bacterium]